MQTLITLGCIAVAILGLVGLIVTGYYSLCEVRGRLREQQFRDAKVNAVKELGYHLKSQSYWFTEDDGAWLALQSVGEVLADTGSLDISGARDVWRAKMKGVREKAEARAESSIES